MNILVACEESQVVTKEFRLLGHNAFSCDVIKTSGDNPEWHIIGDARESLRYKWDMILAFLPCTHLAGSGARWWRQKQQDGRQQKAIDFFMAFVNSNCKRVMIENPSGIMSTIYRKPDQIIQLWMFGHGEMKTTHLWLIGLTHLKSTNVVDGRHQKCWKMPPSADRAKLRSKTYTGIASAMAYQWQYRF